MLWGKTNLLYNCINTCVFAQSSGDVVSVIVMGQFSWDVRNQFVRRAEVVPSFLILSNCSGFSIWRLNSAWPFSMGRASEALQKYSYVSKFRRWSLLELLVFTHAPSIRDSFELRVQRSALYQWTMILDGCLETMFAENALHTYRKRTSPENKGR